MFEADWSFGITLTVWGIYIPSWLLWRVSVWFVAHSIIVERQTILINITANVLQASLGIIFSSIFHWKYAHINIPLCGINLQVGQRYLAGINYIFHIWQVYFGIYETDLLWFNAYCTCYAPQKKQMWRDGLNMKLLYDCILFLHQKWSKFNWCATL